MDQAGADLVRRRGADPITIGMVAGGLVLGAVGVAVAASYSYAYPVGLAVSMIWWGIYFGALGVSLGALPGLITQCARRNRYIARVHAHAVPTILPPNSASITSSGKQVRSHRRCDAIAHRT